MSDDKTLGIYDAQAEKYADLTESASANPALDAFMNAVRPSGRILDLGCGPGLSSAQMAKRGFQVEASDASSEMVKRASQFEGVNARLEDFDALDAVARYDGIFANFSLLHARREAVAGHITQIARALTSGGIFHIGMKTGSGEMRDPIGRHYCYFSEAELETMLTSKGMKLIYRNHGNDLGLDGVMADWVVLHSRKT